MRERMGKFLFISLFILLPLTHYGSNGLSTINLNKLHPWLRSLVTATTDQALAKIKTNLNISVYTDQTGEERYGVIIYTRNTKELYETGIHLNTHDDSYATAKVTLNELIKLSSLSAVDYIDLPALAYKQTNVSTPATGASVLHNGFLNNTSYKGQGSIVVIFDTGIDLWHKDFRDPVDTTKSRILFLWDQTITPVGSEVNPSGFNYGVEYNNTQINNEIDGTPANFVRQQDIDGHGTHVAGTAAGNNAKFPGIAPQADLIVVKGGNGSFPEDNIIDALTYAEAKKTLLSEPIVINYSLGGHYGPHDGSSAHEVAINSFNSKSGQVAVVAAGNDGGNPIHISGSIPMGGNQSIQLSVPDGYTPNSGAANDEVLFHIWYDGLATLTASVSSPNGITYSRTTNTDGSPANNDDGTIYLANYRMSGSKTLVELYVYDENSTRPPVSGTWTLTLSAASAVIGYDGWLVNSDLGGTAATLSDGNTQKTISEPGTAEKAITVGAYVTRLSWPANDGNQYVYTGTDVLDDIANFSSVGPTRDERIKPDITAPGMGIFAALSQNSSSSDLFINPNGKHQIMSGTSMATPHVTGSIALLLAAQPTLTADQVKLLLQNTAAQDAYTGSIPNNYWGNGKLDIFNALVTQLTPDSSARREILIYDAAGTNTAYSFTGTERLAIYYTPVYSGRLSGLYFQLRSANPSINPVISGTGNLLCTVHADNGGIPGVQIGSTVSHPLGLLDPGTKNYINMLPADISVTAGVGYYVVLELSNTSNSIRILFDDGNHGVPANPSYIYTSGSWMTMSTAFGKPYNLCLRSEISSIVNPTDIILEPVTTIQNFSLKQNYPNPFNPSTTIEFILPTAQHVKITVYDILGREVEEVLNADKLAGRYTVQYQPKNLASGVYVYTIAAGPYHDARKFILLR